MRSGARGQVRGVSERTLKTAVGPIAWAPAYYDCAECPEGTPGLTPRDRELGISKDSMSPGLNRMVGRVSSKGPFAEAHEDLLELSGIDVPTKLIERHGEASGELIGRVMEEEWDEIRGTTVPPPVVERCPADAFMYVAMDGTGVPTVPEENKGRMGKGEDGRARTREAKIGCVFTSTAVDEKGDPIRDPESTTMVATMEPAARFGELIKGEALRRGWEQSEVKVVIGDGAEWIWNLADEHFPNAIQVVDLFHSKQRLSELARLLFGGGEMEAWRKAALEELDAGDLGSLLDRLRAVDATRLPRRRRRSCPGTQRRLFVALIGEVDGRWDRLARLCSQRRREVPRRHSSAQPQFPKARERPGSAASEQGDYLPHAIPLHRVSAPFRSFLCGLSHEYPVVLQLPSHPSDGPSERGDLAFVLRHLLDQARKLGFGY